MTDFMTATKPIRSVLVANRGEIACRIIRTCRRLGLRSIAVYSEADSGARHVRLADLAICIGPAPASESYLNIRAIVAAARESVADAIHPGYGFLSENAEFVRACEQAGLVFVGPSSDTVARMGSKIEARRIAEKAGVPILPGFEVTDASPEELAQAADRIGYPIMVKANFGGGGRGMRRVAKPQDLEKALASARQEAGSAFGNSSVFLEKLIEAPRHLEVQVFGDGQGGALHFHERDCSIQRNHQKVIEEAPAPNLSAAIRKILHESAINLTRSMKYAGAGTVEFIMEAGGKDPFFLEMNTRLQVEHPVTEEICGVDLVELQLRQTAGLPILITQEQIIPKGHSIEVRINAERPEAGFVPDTGTFVEVRAPADLRFETGVETNSKVGSHYDSMLAKLVAHGPDRNTARLRLVQGLERLRMMGVATNQAFLLDCLQAQAFIDGRATTAFLEETFPYGWQPDPLDLLRLRGAAALHTARTGPNDPLRRRDGFRVLRGRRNARSDFLIVDDFGEAELCLEMGDAPSALAGGERVDLSDLEPTAVRHGDTVFFSLKGLSASVSVANAAEFRLSGAREGASEGQIAAPLTGLITHVHVVQGEKVAAGQPLVEMEAMKLVYTFTAPFSGIIRNVASATGNTVQAKAVLVEIEEDI